jgi:hypothetical protein
MSNVTGIYGCAARRSPAQWAHDLKVGELLPKMHAAGLPTSITTEVVEGIIRAETNGCPDVPSRAGAEGIMHVMPPTASDLLKSDRMQPFLITAFGGRLETLKAMSLEDLILFSNQIIETIHGQAVMDWTRVGLAS